MTLRRAWLIRHHDALWLLLWVLDLAISLTLALKLALKLLSKLSGTVLCLVQWLIKLVRPRLIVTARGLKFIIILKVDEAERLVEGRVGVIQVLRRRW